MELLFFLLFGSGLGMKWQTFFFLGFIFLSFFLYFYNNWTTQPPVSRAFTVTLQHLGPFVSSSHFQALYKIGAQEDSFNKLRFPAVAFPSRKKKKKGLNHIVTLPTGKEKIHEFPVFCLL